MKKLLGLCAFLLMQLIGNANTYWVWTEEQFRGVNNGVVAGDEINLMGSEITLTSTIEFKGGVHYQSGNDWTVLSGFKKITDWQLYSSNIYYTQLSQEEVNIVTMNGAMQAMGRYPNSGYLTYIGNAGAGTIWGPYYLPTNFTGAEAVVRKKRYLLDRHIIKYQGHDYLEFNLPYYHGNNSNEATPGNGFFIQGHFATLDKAGEWYFDKSTKRLYMVLEGNTEVKVAIPNKLVDIRNTAYVKIDKLGFEGADTLVNTGGSTSIIFDKCSFSKGGSGITGAYTDNIQVWDSKMHDLLSWGIDIEIGGNNTTIKRCDIWNIGLIPGMGNSGNGTYSAISIAGDNTYVEYNTIKNVGYHAINFHGSVVYIRKNLIDGYCVTKDDGGAIYTFCEGVEVFHDRYVSNNIILNGIGNSDGAMGNGDPNGEAAALYNDGYANHTVYMNNFLAGGKWVGYLNSPNKDNTFIGNVVYNFLIGVAINAYVDRDSGQIRGLDMRYNMIVSKDSGQIALLMNQFFAKEPFGRYGNISYNLYVRPVNQGRIIEVDGVRLSLQEWKLLGQDIGTQQSNIHTNNPDNFRMEYNATDNPKTIHLEGVYQGMWGELYSDQITIAPWSGVILLKIEIT